jgi:hypothetical protein
LIRNLLSRVNQSRVAGTVLVAGALLALFLILSHLPLWHTDVWAHVKFGQWMNARGELPSREPFCPYSEDRPYVPMAWLSQRILAGTYELAGVDGLRALHALLITAKALFLFWTYRCLSSSMTLALLGVVFSLGLGLPHVDVLRPQVFGELCLAVMLFATCKPLPSLRASWGVPLLLALWSNLHGSFLNGLLVLFGVMANRFLQEVRENRGVSFRKLFHSPPMRRFFRMFYLGILAVGLLNPLWSFRWYGETWSFGTHPNVQTMDEWQPLDWTSPAGYLFAGSLAVMALTHLAARARGVQGITFGHVLLAICFGVQVIFFQRMLPWWAMLCPYMCMGPWGRIVGMTVTSIERTWMKQLMRIAVVLLAIWIGIAWSPLGIGVLQGRRTPTEQALHPATPLFIARASRPVAGPARQETLADALLRPRSAVFASETLGDYLLFATPLKMVIYTHVHLFSVDHWQRCLIVKRGEAQAEKVLRDWNVQTVCVEAELHPRLCARLKQSGEWTVILDESGDMRKRDPKSRLFVAVRK